MGFPPLRIQSERQIPLQKENADENENESGVQDESQKCKNFIDSLFNTRNKNSRQGVFCKKGVLRDFAKFAEKKTCTRVSFLIRPWHRCFPVNFPKFLRIPFLTEKVSHLRRK